MGNIIKNSEYSYFNEWKISSIEYEKRGYYDWCINQIENAKNILEVGSGIGISTKKLIEKFSNITSIESNSFNFSELELYLKEHSPIIIKNDADYKRFSINNINLINKNFITDKLLKNNILDLVSFDTVICWFLGVHPNAYLDPELIKMGYKEKKPLEYRDLIYSKIFKIVSKSIPKDGIINLIERHVYVEVEEIDKLKQQYHEFYNLKAYNLEILKINQIEIDNIKKVPGIEMKVLNNDGSENFNNNKHALISITIIKI